MKTPLKIILTVVAIMLGVIIIVLVARASSNIDLIPIWLGAIIGIALSEVIRAIWKSRNIKN